ncbi:MAG: acetyl-CoA carboxylase biotin carboxyl carrier protein [Gemmatimonadales bacterium]|nr:acetyl-CoA carboxylase biotin carboxyl carrier protein [Gemmatimonadales bacterium]
MDIKKVRELVKLVEESGIEELEISHQDTTIRIQKSPTGLVSPAAVLSPGMQVPASVAQPIPVDVPMAATSSEPAIDPVRAKYKDVRSPIVGTIYRAASPTSDPFVNVGDHVAVGQTLCIVEAMKVMNEIEAEFSGTIREILVENGKPVEAEAVLFLIDPD